MIHRKWSLLTGPVAILGAVVGTVAIANFVFIQNDRFHLIQGNKKQHLHPSEKRG